MRKIEMGVMVILLCFVGACTFAKYGTKNPSSIPAIHDLNGDGIVDISDVILEQRAIYEHDINGDGVVDHADVEALMREAVGQ